MTPPPLNMAQQNDHQSRTAASTREYAEAVAEIGQKAEGVALVDVWTAIMQTIGWKSDADGPLPGSLEQQGDFLRPYLSDGRFEMCCPFAG